MRIVKVFHSDPPHAYLTVVTLTNDQNFVVELGAFLQEKVIQLRNVANIGAVSFI